MAKVHLDRLKKKYGAENITGKSYQEIVELIIDQNTTNIKNKILRMNAEQWSRALKKVTPKEKRFVLPDISDVLPKRAVSARKAAEKGQLISDTLRDRLTKDLRNTLTAFTTATGKPAMTRQAGATAGRINPELINFFQQKITKTFKNYTKKDPKIGMPKNLQSTAVTEVRSSINQIKAEYSDQLINKNPDILLKKKWVQNRSLAEEPRKGHNDVDGKVVLKDEKFKVPLYKTTKGIKKKVGFTMMRFPHDPTAPPEQVISCHCDYDIIISRRK